MDILLPDQATLGFLPIRTVSEPWVSGWFDRLAVKNNANSTALWLNLSMTFPYFNKGIRNKNLNYLAHPSQSKSREIS